MHTNVFPYNNGVAANMAIRTTVIKESYIHSTVNSLSDVGPTLAKRQFVSFIGHPVSALNGFDFVNSILILH